MKHPIYGQVSIHRISQAMTDTLHDCIYSWYQNGTNTAEEMKAKIENWLSVQSVHHAQLTVVIVPVYYFGFLQGVRVILVDRKHRTQRQVTPRGKVYAIHVGKFLRQDRNFYNSPMVGHSGNGKPLQP